MFMMEWQSDGLYLAMQGMNFVAAMLLLVMKTEEEAFWMLAVLVENVLFDDCYSENLYGCHVEQRVFKDLFQKKLPRYLILIVCLTSSLYRCSSHL